MVDFKTVTEFENKIAKFFGAPYAIALDGATHGIELCLRLLGAKWMISQKHTYVSVPMLANKLGIDLYWQDDEWKDYYKVYEDISWPITVYDSAVLWERNSFIQNSLMCISCQYQKHLSVGRLGFILSDNEVMAEKLKKMSYDGRRPEQPWRTQNIDTMGYHYYAQPELAQLALDKLDIAIQTEPRKWSVKDWPNISEMDIFSLKNE